MTVLASKAARKNAPASSYIPSLKVTHKRGLSEITEPFSADVPKKVLKLRGEERIKELETQIRELHEFDFECGVAYGL
jgi:hypothetical protein